MKYFFLILPIQRFIPHHSTKNFLANHYQDNQYFLRGCDYHWGLANSRSRSHSNSRSRSHSHSNSRSRSRSHFSFRSLSRSLSRCHSHFRSRSRSHYLMHLIQSLDHHT